MRFAMSNDSALIFIVAANTLAVAAAVWFLVSPSDEDDSKLARAEAKRRSYRTEIIRLTFRALKAVAVADGIFHESERELLEACEDVLTVSCPDLEELEPISPQDLAGSIIAREPEKVATLLQLMVHVSLVDGEEHPTEFQAVQRFGVAFGVSLHVLNELRLKVMEDHKASQEELHKSQAALAGNPAAKVVGSAGFYALLASLCHR